jgi:hypothetical protein
METVNNLTSAATRAIFGDTTKDAEINASQQEPLSGETGNVEAGEPYDKGNLELAGEENAKSATTADPITKDLPLRPAQDSTSKSTDGENEVTKTDPLGETESKDPISQENVADKAVQNGSTSATTSDTPASSNDISQPKAELGLDVGADKTGGVKKDKSLVGLQQGGEEIQAGKVDASGPISPRMSYFTSYHLL